MLYKLTRIFIYLFKFTSIYLNIWQEFDSSRDADDAIYDLNGKELAGERVMLEFSRRGPRADAYGGRGGGGRDSFGARGGNRYGIFCLRELGVICFFSSERRVPAFQYFASSFKKNKRHVARIDVTMARVLR